jgi:hypothetical protein
MAARLGEQIEIVETAFPAILFKNRDDIRGIYLPILWIPWIKDLGTIDVHGLTFFTFIF